MPFSVTYVRAPCLQGAVSQNCILRSVRPSEISNFKFAILLHGGPPQRAPISHTTGRATTASAVRLPSWSARSPLPLFYKDRTAPGKPRTRSASALQEQPNHKSQPTPQPPPEQNQHSSLSSLPRGESQSEGGRSFAPFKSQISNLRSGRMVADRKVLSGGNSHTKNHQQNKQLK